VILRAGVANVDRELRGVHVTDLDRPGRWILPDELVLTNGLWLEKALPGVWVKDVVAAGAAALGFGIGTPHEVLPEALIDACNEFQLPLLEIPETVSFSLFSHHAASGGESIRGHLERSRQLLRAFAGGGGYTSLLEVLHETTGLSAALVGPGGKQLAQVGQPLSAATLSHAELAAVRGPLPVQLEEAAVISASALAPPRATLVITGALSDLEDPVRATVELVGTVAALENSRDHASQSARQVYASELVELTLRPNFDESLCSTRLESLGLSPAHGLIALAGAMDVEQLRYALTVAGADHVAGQHGDAALAIVAAGGQGLLPAVVEALDRLRVEPVLGCGSTALDIWDLPRTAGSALSALAAARNRPRGARVVRESDMGTHVALMDLLPPAARQQFLHAVLGRLEERDHKRSTDLVGTLSVFLDSGGRWRESAATLHIHPNTLRYRLSRVEELSGRDLQSTRDRTDFQLALAIRAERPEALLSSSSTAVRGPHPTADMHSGC